MRAIYKRTLIFIGILIGLCMFLGVAYLFYDRIINSVEVQVIDELSVNFLNGSLVNVNGDYEFSVTNSSDNSVYYEVGISDIKDYQEGIKFNIISPDANISLTNVGLNASGGVVVNNILLEAKDTHNFKLRFEGITTATFKLSLKKVTDSEEYFYTTILKNNNVKDVPLTKVGVDLATTDEGLIKDVDDLGTTYFFRGAVNNNYVRFADLTWRIVKINGDNTVKIVLNEVADDLANYHDSMDGYENLINNQLNGYLEVYYDTYLKDNDQYITNSKYCLEVGSNNDAHEKIYNSYERLITNKIPTFNCLGDKYSKKIGLLTADEVAYAGGNFASDNKDYYLYNEKIENIWWTSTLAKSSSSVFYPFCVNNSGKIVFDVEGSLFRGLRPVINLNKKISVTGDGTINNPYVIDSKST